MVGQSGAAERVEQSWAAACQVIGAARRGITAAKGTAATGTADVPSLRGCCLYNNLLGGYELQHCFNIDLDNLFSGRPWFAWLKTFQHNLKIYFEQGLRSGLIRAPSMTRPTLSARVAATTHVGSRRRGALNAAAAAPRLISHKETMV